MFESRNLRLDLAALVLLALTIFLGMALTTYAPGDALDTLIYPRNEHPANACGRAGALVADLLLQGLGIGAYYLVLTLAYVDARLLARRPITEPVLRTFGWLLSLAGLCTISAMAIANWSPGPVIGPGGYLGATGR